MNILLNSPWSYLATAAFVALIGVYAWRQPHRPGTRYFHWLLWLWFIMTLAGAFTSIVQTTELRYWLWVLQCISAMFVVSVGLMFSLEYTGNEKWLNPRNLVLLSLPILIFGLLAITLPMNYLVSVEMHFGNEVIIAKALMKWVFVTTVLVVWTASAVVLAGSLLHAPAFSAPIGLIIVGQAIPLISFLAIDPDVTVVSPIRISILLTNFSALAYIIALYFFQFLRLVPVAWDNAINQMPYGMIVLDAEDILVAFNPEAQALPGLSSRLVLRQAASKTLGEWWERIFPLIGSEQVSKDIVIKTSAGQQQFQVYSLPLLHVSGWRMGQLFVLEDVTQARQAQELLRQNLWTQATQKEREQLAYELHDGLSQQLAFLNLLAQAAQVQIQGGQNQAALGNLDRLTEAASQIQEDTRELIGDLLTISLPAEDFCASLRQILTHFEQQTGLMVDLDIDADMTADSCFATTRLPPSVAVQLVRMTQEALANVRKHARGAGQVNVKLKANGGGMILTIKDDGAGFDPAVQRIGGKQFGLHVIRQRAASIGAQVAIDSAPGKGTCIEINAPLADGETRVKG